MTLTWRWAVAIAGACLLAGIGLALLFTRKTGPDPEIVAAQLAAAKAQGAELALREYLSSKDVENPDLARAIDSMKEMGLGLAAAFRAVGKQQTTTGPQVQPVTDAVTGQTTCPAPDISVQPTTEAAILRGAGDEWFLKGQTNIALAQIDGPWKRNLPFPLTDKDGNTLSFKVDPRVIERAPDPRTSLGWNVGGWVNTAGGGPLTGLTLDPKQWAVNNRFFDTRVGVTANVHLRPDFSPEGGEAFATFRFAGGRR